jgi:hypothetical protein
MLFLIKKSALKFGRKEKAITFAPAFRAKFIGGIWDKGIDVDEDCI